MSIVWEFFEIIQNDSAKAICILCNTRLSRGGKEARSFNTSNMMAHLKKTHNDEFLEAKERRNEAGPPTPTAKTPNSSEHGGSAPKRRCTVSRTKNLLMMDNNITVIKKLVAEMIIIDLQPVGIIEGMGFRRLLEHICPDCNIPNQDYFKDLIEFNIYDKITSAINSHLRQLDCISLALDLWNLGHSDEMFFLTITAQGMTSTFDPLSFLLGVLPIPASQTSTLSVENPILECLEKFDLPFSQVHMAVCTNEALIEEVRKAGLKSFHSFSHALQSLVYNNVLRRRVIKELLAKVQHIIYIKNRSDPPKLDPDKKCYGMPLHSLTQEVFNLLEQSKVSLAAESSRSKTHSLNLSPKELLMCEQLIALLRPFEQVIKESFSGNSKSSYIIPAVKSLQLFVERGISPECSYFDHIKFVMEDLKVGLQTKFEDVFHDRKLCLATYLDPRFKRNACLKSNLLDLKGSILEELLMLRKSCRSEVPQVDNEEDSLKEEEESDGNNQNFPSFDQFFDAVLLGTELESSSEPTGNDYVHIKSEFKLSYDEDAVEKEIEVYESSALIPTSEDPIVWWQNNHTSFPHLSKLARKFLSCSSSSTTKQKISEVQAEQLLGRQLPVVDVEKMLFMRQNLIMMDFHYSLP